MSLREAAMTLLALAAAVAAGTRVASALPHPDEPIDASKRAPISTQGAVRPAANPPRGSGVVGDGRIPVTRAVIPEAAVKTPEGSIAVRETREKAVRRPHVRKSSASRRYDVKRASALPASIPSIDRDQYRKILTAYREGRTSAADMTQVPVRKGKHRPDLADINRFAGPRAALERQGIPVVPAGSASPGKNTAPAPTPLPADVATPEK